jgi:hypothetical protein
MIRRLKLGDHHLNSRNHQPRVGNAITLKMRCFQQRGRMRRRHPAYANFVQLTPFFETVLSDR